MPPRRPVLLLIPPPLLYAACFGLSLLPGLWLPLSPAWMNGPACQWSGRLLAGAAGLIALSSLGLFLARRTTFIPHHRPTDLVTGGPYACSRNPMYVALTLLYCGVVLLVQSLWPLIFLPLPLAVMNLAVIPYEERRLREIFGPAYDQYRHRVRRWL